MVKMPVEILYVFEWSTPHSGLKTKATNRWSLLTMISCIVYVTSAMSQVKLLLKSGLKLKPLEFFWSDEVCAINIELAL